MKLHLIPLFLLLTSAALASGTVEYRDSLGRSLKIAYGDRPQVWRDGVERPFAPDAPLWRDASGNPSRGPISLGWKAPSASPPAAAPSPAPSRKTEP